MAALCKNHIQYSKCCLLVYSLRIWKQSIKLCAENGKSKWISASWETRDLQLSRLTTTHHTTRQENRQGNHCREIYPIRHYRFLVYPSLSQRANPMWLLSTSNSLSLITRQRTFGGSIWSEELQKIRIDKQKWTPAWPANSSICCSPSIPALPWRHPHPACIYPTRKPGISSHCPSTH